jgi:ribosomal protein S10
VGILARWAKVKYKHLVKLRDELERLQQENLDRFQKDMVKELAERLLKNAVKRTPMSFPNRREGWTIGSIHHSNGSYEVEVYNNSKNAYSVEWGYQTEDKIGWVPGRFMLHISEKELELDADRIVEDKLMKLLRKVFP